MTPTDNHTEVSRRFIQQAGEELERGDVLQASEKAWGSAARAVKSVADRRGWEHDSHRRLFAVVRRVAEQSGDPDIRRLFSAANGLHANFYEGQMDTETVIKRVEEVRLLIRKLEATEGVSS